MNESFYRRNCRVCNAMFHMSCILVNILCLKLSQFYQNQNTSPSNTIILKSAYLPLTINL